ncbi:hypothetical protein D3C78_507800 [compost metagenome]
MLHLLQLRAVGGEQAGGVDHQLDTCGPGERVRIAGQCGQIQRQPVAAGGRIRLARRGDDLVPGGEECGVQVAADEAAGADQQDAHQRVLRVGGVSGWSMAITSL